MNGNPVTPSAVVPGPAPAGGAKSAPGTEGVAAESRGCWWNRDWLLLLAAGYRHAPGLSARRRGQRLWDDDAHLTPPALRSLEGLARIWTQIGATQQYYPLTFTAFWVQHKLWGDSTLGYHWVNIHLHSLSALLFLAILRQLKIPGAWLAAACFALHPVHVESVAWMTQLKNTLSGVLCLGSLAAYLGFDQTRKKRLYALALGLFALGLLGKTAIAPLPAGMLVILWWKRRRLSWRQDALPLAPFFLAGLAAGLITVWLEQNLYGARGAEFEFSFQERGPHCWPRDLVPPGQTALARQFAVHVSPLAGQPGRLAAIPVSGGGPGAIAGLWRLRHWSRAPLAALLCFIAALFPTLGFFSACTFQHTFVNDHHQVLGESGHHRPRGIRGNRGFGPMALSPRAVPRAAGRPGNPDLAAVPDVR